MSIGAAGLWLIVGAAWDVWDDPTTLFDKPPVAAWPLPTLEFWNTTVTQLFWLAGLAAVPTSRAAVISSSSNR